MVRHLKNTLFVLIILSGIVTVYLSIKYYDLKPSEIVCDDSFNFPTKAGDTLQLSYLNENLKGKDFLFVIDCYVENTAGGKFSIAGMKSGEKTFGRLYEIRDSSLIYKKHRIEVGESFKDTIVSLSTHNIFQKDINVLSITNNGFVKAVSVGFEKSRKVIFEKPILMISGQSHDHKINNEIVIKFYRSLPYLVIILGLFYGYLNYRLKRKKNSYQYAS